MDIQDYNSRLSAARQQYRDSADELKENYKRDLNNLKKAADAKQAQQQKTYMESKQNLEETNKENLEFYNKKTQEEIARRQSDFLERSRAQQKNYEKNMQVAKKDFKNRIQDISTTFDTARKENAKLNKSFKENVQEKFEKGLAQNQQRYEGDMAKMVKNSSEKFNAYRDKLNDEKRDLMLGLRAEKQALVQDGNIEKRKAIDTLQLDLERVRQTHEQEMANREAHHANMLEHKNNMAEAQVNDLKDTFADTTDRLNRRFQKDLTDLADQNVENKRNLENEFSDNKVSLERKLASVQDSASFYNTENLKKRLQESYDIKQKSILEKMDEQKLRHNLHKQKMAQDFNNELEENTLNSQRIIESKDRELRNYGMNKLAPLKKESQQQIEYYQKELNKSNAAREENALANKKNLSEKMNNMRLQYGKTLKAMEEDRDQTISDLKNVQREERTEYIKETNRRTNQERLDLIEELRSKYGNRISQLEASYEKLVHEKNMQKEDYERKMADMTDQFKKTFKDYQKIEEDRRFENTRAFQRSFGEQQRSFEKQIKLMKQDFDARMQKIKFITDRKQTETVKSYEDQLVQQRKELDKEMKTKISTLQNKLLEIQTQNEINMNAMKEQYELKMEQLRQANLIAEQRKEASDLA